MQVHGVALHRLIDVDDRRDEEENSKQDRCRLARIIRVD